MDLREKLTEIVRSTAERLHFLNEKGALMPLDSIACVDLAMELELSTSVRIPIELLDPKHFVSLSTVVELLITASA